MPLRKPWRDLDRETVAKAPDRPGVYELGDDAGAVRSVGHGVLRDELKTALASTERGNSRPSTASASSDRSAPHWM